MGREQIPLRPTGIRGGQYRGSFKGVYIMSFATEQRKESL